MSLRCPECQAITATTAASARSAHASSPDCSGRPRQSGDHLSTPSLRSNSLPAQLSQTGTSSSKNWAGAGWASLQGPRQEINEKARAQAHQAEIAADRQTIDRFQNEIKNHPAESPTECLPDVPSGPGDNNLLHHHGIHPGRKPQGMIRILEK